MSAPMPSSGDAIPQTSSMAEWARGIGLALVLLAALLHARLSLAALPLWDADPLVQPPPLAPPKALGLWDTLTSSLDSAGPTASLLFSLMGLAGAALMLTVAPRGRSLLGITLALAGSLPAFWHVLSGTPESVRLGANWLFAIWAGLAVWHQNALPRWRATTVGLLLGFLIVLVAKGTLQVAVEHADTVAAFEADREGFLRARNTEPGSPMALAYERRLRQPEATGWFGLSNVFASFMGAGLVAAAGFWWRSRAAPLWARWGALALTFACALGLILTRSKGGIAAAGAGLLLLGACELARRRPFANRPLADRWAGLAAVSLGALALFAVVVRGLIGLRMSELSLLFRWFYLEASARIFANNPLAGVGPAGYQTAYARAKNPLSPEEVVSPHSIAADFACTLGVAGLAWVALIAWWVHRAGPGLLASPGDPPLAADPGPVTRPRIYAMAAVLAGVTILPQVLAPGGTLAISIAAALSNADPVPFSALAAGLGAEAALAGLWIGAAIAIGRCVLAAPGAGAAGAVVLWMHAQIEMTPVQPGSAPLFVILLAALVSPARPRPVPGRIRRELLVIAPWAAVGVVMNSFDRVQLRDTWLVRAMRATEPAASLVREHRDIERASLAPRDRSRQLDELDARLAEYLRSASPTARPITLDDRLEAVRRHALSAGLADLWKAASVTEGRDPVAGALYLRRLLMAHMVDPAMGGRSSPAYGMLFPFVRSAVARLPGNPTMWMLYGDALDLARVQGLPPPALHENELPEPSAAEAWRRAHELDPHSPVPVDRLIDEALRVQDLPEAARWATLRLELDENSRLDRTRLLSDRERAWIRAVAESKPVGPRPGKPGEPTRGS